MRSRSPAGVVRPTFFFAQEPRGVETERVPLVSDLLRQVLDAVIESRNGDGAVILVQVA